MHHFHTKLSYQKLMLRQTEWWVQNRPITNNGVLPVITLFFWSFCFSFRTSCKELIWCTSDPNVHIPTFCKRWSFIWLRFFPVSIFKKLWYCYWGREIKKKMSISSIGLPSKSNNVFFFLLFMKRRFHLSE